MHQSSPSSDESMQPTLHQQDQKEEEEKVNNVNDSCKWEKQKVVVCLPSEEEEPNDSSSSCCQNTIDQPPPESHEFVINLPNQQQRHRHSVCHIAISVKDESGEPQYLVVDDPSESTNPQAGVISEDVNARLKLRRKSEQAVDIMRFAAEYRRRELEELLFDHANLLSATARLSGGTSAADDQ